MRQGEVRLLRAPSSGSSATLALGGAEVVAAFEVIRDELEVHERFKLRSVPKSPGTERDGPRVYQGAVCTSRCPESAHLALLANLISPTTDSSIF